MQIRAKKWKKLSLTYASWPASTDPLRKLAVGHAEQDVRTGSPLEVRREFDAEANALEDVDPRTAGALLRVGTAEELLHCNCLLSKDGRELRKES